MGFARRLARQLAEPTGMVGALCGLAMDVVNRTPLRHAVDLLAPRDGETVLDAGCGTGAASAEILRRAACHVVAVDRSETMIDRARSRFAGRRGAGAIELHRASIEDLPCRPGSMDAVLALNILYFCDPENGMIAALRAMLRPGGRLVAYVTDRGTMEKWAFTRAGHHRLYDAAELEAALVGGGFDRSELRIESRAMAAGAQGLFALARAS